MTSEIRVLHVDDEPDIADMVATFLKQHDERIDVKTVTAPEEAFERLENGGYDCVVSDFDMPTMDGITFLEAVRQQYPDLPFILFTGKGSEKVASDAISAGVSDYLQKGVGTEQYELLATRIQNHVQRTRAKKASQRQLKAIETAQEGIAILNSAGYFIYVNRRYATLHGFDSEELIDKHWEELYPEDQLQMIHDDIFPQVSESGVWRGETVGLRADGSTFIGVSTFARTENDELVTTVRDVTETREQEQALEELTQRYQTIVEESRDGIRIVQNGTVEFVNNRLAEMLGYSKQELQGMQAEEIIAPEWVDDVRNYHDARMQEETVPDLYEVELETKTGNRLQAELSVTRIQYRREPASLSMIRDVTQRNKRDRKLQLFRKATEHAGHAIYITDTDGVIQYVNPAFERITGYASDTAVGQTPKILNSGEMQDEYYESLWSTLQAGEVWEEAIINRRKSGECYPAYQTIAPITDDADEPTAFVAIQSEITNPRE